MKKKASNYADIVEKNKEKLKKDGYSYKEIEWMKKAKDMGKVKTSRFINKSFRI